MKELYHPIQKSTMPKRKSPSKAALSDKKKSKTPAPIMERPDSAIFHNLLKLVKQYVYGKNYRPATHTELMQKLGLPIQHEELIRQVLEALCEDGEIILSKGCYTSPLKTKANIISGVIKMHPRGFGFVKPEGATSYGEDIFIPKHLTMNSVDGDTVEVAISEVVSEKGPEGKVVTVLERNRTHIAGVINQISNYGEIIAYVPLFGLARRIIVDSTPDFTPVVGDRVVMKVLDWGDDNQDMHCSISHLLGHISDPSCDIAAAIEEFALRGEFPNRAIREAESFGRRVSMAEIAEREDLRDWECVTIDPDTAKDFDDAITLNKDKKGFYHLGVHIADVSHYVTPNSAIDKEASLRCNSTYFPGSCLPMLPSELSENLCSLKPKVNRLTVSVFLRFNKKGTLLDYRISRTVIRSAKRFTYRQAKEVLDGSRQSAHAPLLHLMVELCKLLKEQRRKRGSIEFYLPELAIMVDENGIPYKTDYIPYDITHQMIEEFMLKANEVIAWHLSSNDRGVIFRVHEEPSEENLQDFLQLAQTFGFKMPKKPTAHDLQKFFDEVNQTSHGQYLATSYIRKMRQATYAPENIGHHGLALTYYCHFTSPIRRYVDLQVHRALFSRIAKQKNLPAIALRCSEQERISAKAENSVVLLKKLRLLDKLHTENPLQQFNAVVTQVKQFGFSFEVLDFMLEGFLHVSALEDDYFVFDGARAQLEGRHTQKRYTSGTPITVMLREVDFIQLDSKWNLVCEGGDSERQKSKRRDGKRPYDSQRSKRPAGGFKARKRKR